MKRTFFLLSILARSVFALLFLFDFLLIAKIGGELATNGVKGVKGWILHAGSMGKIIIESSGPDSMTIHFPSSGPIFREFFIMCGVLLVLTLVSFWFGRLFGRKARQAS
jgi:hypothetical protein